MYTEVICPIWVQTVQTLMRMINEFKVPYNNYYEYDRCSLFLTLLSISLTRKNTSKFRLKAMYCKFGRPAILKSKGNSLKRRFIVGHLLASLLVCTASNKLKSLKWQYWHKKSYGPVEAREFDYGGLPPCFWIYLQLLLTKNIICDTHRPCKMIQVKPIFLLILTDLSYLRVARMPRRWDLTISCMVTTDKRQTTDNNKLLYPLHMLVG